jgi:hypothetical protein
VVHRNDYEESLVLGVKTPINADIGHYLPFAVGTKPYLVG